MWDLPRSGIKPLFLALRGGLFTTEPPGKPRICSVAGQTPLPSASLLWWPTPPAWHFCPVQPVSSRLLAHLILVCHALQPGRSMVMGPDRSQLWPESSAGPYPQCGADERSRVSDQAILDGMVGQLFWSVRWSEISLDFIPGTESWLSQVVSGCLWNWFYCHQRKQRPQVDSLETELFYLFQASHFATCLCMYCRARFWDLPPTCYLKFWNQRAVSWELEIL